MTRQFHGTKVTFMERIKVPRKVSLAPCLKGFQYPYQLSNKGHLLAGPEPHDILGISRREELIYPNLVKSDGDLLAFLLSMEMECLLKE